VTGPEVFLVGRQVEG